MIAGRRQDYCIALVLAMLVVSVFWQVRDFSFVNFDDTIHVSQNTHVQGGITATGMAWAFTHAVGGMWHPLTSLSHMLDCHLFGLNARWSHAVNAFLHAANTLLLFFILMGMTHAKWRCGLVAALFAVHPIHVESVAWVAERKDVLSTFFWMLTMGAYGRYVRDSSLKKYAVMVGMFILGLLAKPMLVTLPCVLLLLDYWPLQRFSQRGWFLPAVEKIPLFVIAGFFGAAAFYFQRSENATAELANLAVWPRIANAIVAYCLYLGKMVWPIHLAAFYPHPGATLPAWKIASGVALLAGVSMIAIWKRRVAPYFLMGWLWFLGTLVPVIGLVQIGSQAMADRYTYVPMTGIFIMIAWGIPDLRGLGRILRILLGTALSLWILALAACAWKQAGYWRNSVTLMKHALDVTSGNWLAHHNLGFAFCQERKLEEAAMHYRECLRILPDSKAAHIGLGQVLVLQGKIQEALAEYSWTSEGWVDLAMGHKSVADILAGEKKVAQAMEEYARALELRPDWAEAHYNLGNLLAQEQKWQEAVEHYQAAIRSEPSNTKFYNNLGVAYSNQGRFAEAIACYSKALKIDTQDEQLQSNLQIALGKQAKGDRNPSPRPRSEAGRAGR